MTGANSVVRFGRRSIYRPLAVLLLSVLPPLLPGLPPGAGIRLFEASAQFTTNRIVQNCPLGLTCADLMDLENKAVNSFLERHALPPGDADIIYDLGREDLRDEIRGHMFADLLRISATPQSSRTAPEQRIYTWLQELVQQNEIEQYTLARNEFSRWFGDQCRFTLDADVAKQYGISYDGTPFCFASPSDLFGGPPVPAEGYFTAYGLKLSYGKPALTEPGFASLVSNTSEKATLALRVGSFAYFVLAAGLTVYATITLGAALFATGQLLFLTTVGLPALPAASVVAGALGPAAIILVAIIIGVTAGMQAFTNQQTLDNLNNLSAKVVRVTNTPPDLAAFATDSAGAYKLLMTFTGQTVPDVPSSAALPAHSNADLNFAIQASGAPSATISETLTYQDWTGNDWSARTSGGWLVQTCSGASCPQTDSIIGSIKYVDWAGVQWTALRRGNKFLGIRDEPGAIDKGCSYDAAIDGDEPPDFSACSGYVSTSIPLKDANGVLVTASLSVLTPPVFTGLSSLPFTPGAVSTQSIPVSGNPPATVCYVGSTPALPADFSMNGAPLNPGTCASGAFPLLFNGNAASPETTYQLTLGAVNGTTQTTVLKTIQIDVSPHLMITSPATISGTAGAPVHFTVTTTGVPTPQLSVDPRLLELMPGITFTNNGNGTGTFSGSTPVPVVGGFCIPACGITATSSQGTVVQGMTIDLVSSPGAFMGPPTSATFIAGAPNSVDLTSVGAITPVHWNFDPTAPPWVDFTDNGDGTATLSGEPPPNVTGTFDLFLGPQALGSFGALPKFVLTVVNTPVFLSPSATTFTVGTVGSFVARTNLGVLGVSGTLPNGLGFYPPNTLQCLLFNVNGACIAGTPALGAGGQYEVIVTVDGGAAGSTFQSLMVNIYEAPKIGTADSATFLIGAPGSFAVVATGFPSLSTGPVDNPTPPTGPDDGAGMYFTVTGLPPGFQASNLNPQGFATGTLLIEGTPEASDAGQYQVQITAQNGVGAPSQQTLKLLVTDTPPTTSTVTTSTVTTSTVPTTTAVGATSTVTTTTAVGATNTTSSTLPACTSARCLIDAAKTSGACANQTIPTRVLKNLDRAARLIEQSTTNGFKKSLVRKTKKSLKAAKNGATKAAKGKKPKISTDCAAALKDVADRVLAGLQT